MSRRAYFACGKVLSSSRTRSLFASFRSLSSATMSSTPSWCRYEEPLADYRPGGYRPTKIGEVLAHGRYKLELKLGWGVHSTVWMAQDLQDPNRTGVSVKIMTGECLNAPQLQEIQCMRCLSASDLVHPGASHVSRLLDTFVTESSSGQHICVVTELLAESVPDIIERFPDTFKLPEYAAKGIMRDVLLGLDFCHRNGVVHADVKFSNISAKLPMELSLAGCSFNRNPMTHDAVAGNSEVVTITESMRIKSMPTDINGEESWRNKSYALIDFGSACLLDSGRKLLSRAYPIAYRAPEVAVEAGWDTAADIWAAGCMLFSMLTHFNLYPPVTDDKTLPVLQMQLFGNLPPDLIACSKKRDVFWDENGDIYAPFRITYPTFDELLQQAAPLMTPQCSDFLRRMLTVDPGKRATVQDLLGHPWLAA